MFNILAVFLGGGIGSILRWMVCNKINTHWGTMAVNVIGAFLIGCAYAYISQKTNLRSEIRLFVMTGLLGGFTTFSTYLLDFTNLINKGSLPESGTYLAFSIIIGVCGLLAGIKLVA